MRSSCFATEYGSLFDLCNKTFTVSQYSIASWIIDGSPMDGRLMLFAAASIVTMLVKY